MNGGYNSFTPPPIPQKRKDVGWIWALAGCGGLIVLFIVGLAVAFSSNKKEGLAGLASNVMEASTTGEELVPIRDRLKMYRDDHNGNYPARLKDLAPKYLSPEDLDDLTQRKALYTPPGKDAPDDFAVITVTTKSSEMLGQKVFYYAKILKDDEVVMDQLTRTRVDSRGRSSGGQNQDDN